MAGTAAGERGRARHRDRRQRADVGTESGALARCPGRASRHSVQGSPRPRSRGGIGRDPRAEPERGRSRSGDGLPAGCAERAGRAAGIAAPRVFENRRAARLHQPDKPARAVLRSISGDWLQPGRAAARNRLARSAAGRRVLHDRSGGGNAGPHQADQLPDMPCIGYHPRCAGHDRAQQHGRRGRKPDAGDRQPERQSPDAASGSMGRLVRHIGGRGAAVCADGASRQHHVLGARQYLEPGLRGLAECLADIARLSLLVERHRRAARVRPPDARHQPADAVELGVAGRGERRRSGGHERRLARARERAGGLPAVCGRSATARAADAAGRPLPRASRPERPGTGEAVRSGSSTRSTGCCAIRAATWCTPTRSTDCRSP